MKRCAQCGRHYVNAVSVCPADGQPLIPVKPGAESDRSWLERVTDLIACGFGHVIRLVVGGAILLWCAGRAAVFLGLGILFALIAWDDHSLHMNLKALRSSGIETKGTIEMVSMTRTTRRRGAFSDSYKFDVGYLDSSGTRRTVSIPVSYSTYDSHTVEGGKKFTRHEIDLIYLPSNPEFIRVRGGSDPDSDMHSFCWLLWPLTMVFIAGGSLYAWDLLSVFWLRKSRTTKQAEAIMNETPEANIARSNSTLRTDPNYQTGTTTFTNTGLSNTLCPDPSDREAWFQFGLSQISLSRFDEALVALEHAHRLGHPEAGKHLGYWRQKLGR